MVSFFGAHWATLLLLLWAGGYSLAALQYGIEIKPHPQSGFVPILLGILIFGLAGFALIRALRKEAPSGREAEESLPRKNFFSFVLLLLASTASFEYLGFCFTSIALIFLTAYSMGLRGWGKALLLAVLATLAADVIFAGLLGVPLPGVLSLRLLGGF